MTPQERERVTDLFNRLTQLENVPREREAVDMIAEGLRIAPNAPYALVQTVLIQEEALARANERIQELEAQQGEPVQTGGFLDTVRGALSGQPAAPRRGSVPSTRGGSQPMGIPPGLRRDASPTGGQQQEIGRGGSFLGQAASIAAGVLVGSMAADALRGQFGSEAGKPANDQHAATEQDTRQQADAGDTSGGDGSQYDTADLGGDFDFGGGDFG